MWLKQLVMASVTTFKPFTEFLHEAWLLSLFIQCKLHVHKLLLLLYYIRILACSEVYLKDGANALKQFSKLQEM